MGERCCACRQTFAAGDEVVTFYLERVLQGEKSGLPGFYEHPQSPDNSTDHVHFNYSCLEKCFSPIENPFMYDSIADQVRREILEEEREVDEFAIEDVQDPPFCLWCKREDSVWLQERRGGTVYCCLVCNKLWDDEENELVWDSRRNTYVNVE